MRFTYDLLMNREDLFKCCSGPKTFLNEHLKGFRTEDKGKAGIRKPEGITFGHGSSSLALAPALLNQKGQKNTKGGNFKEFSPHVKIYFFACYLWRQVSLFSGIYGKKRRIKGIWHH